MSSGTEKRNESDTQCHRKRQSGHNGLGLQCLRKENANILDISQTVMSECFTMIMLLDVSDLSSSFKEFKEEMAELGKNHGLEIAVHREEIFRACNRI